MSNILRQFLKDENHHPLLEPQAPVYSNRTVKRASILWLHSGKLNEFKYVCDYYHRLEAMEEELSSEARINSRLLELNLVSELKITSDDDNIRVIKPPTQIRKPKEDEKIRLMYKSPDASSLPLPDFPNMNSRPTPVIMAVREIEEIRQEFKSPDPSTLPLPEFSNMGICIRDLDETEMIKDLMI